MGYNTAIEWAHHTFNPWMGCAKVSTGCKHCYAETLMDTRWGKVEWGVNGTRVRTSESNWRKPLAWNREAEKLGIRYRVFCASLADVFEDRDELQPWREDLFNLIYRTPHLDWLLLTKRPDRMLDFISRSAFLSNAPLPNVWLGTSVENQETANERIPQLLECPAKVHFLSMEPLLGPVDLTRFFEWSVLSGPPWLCNDDEVGAWVICGGESGHGARPMHPDWVRSIRDQCIGAHIPFLFKQWGEWAPCTGSGVGSSQMMMRRDGTEIALSDSFDPVQGDAWLVRLGKNQSGRLLNGRTWDEVPCPAVEVGA